MPREVGDAARRLRKDMTQAEETLWGALRKGQLAGLQFRKQHAIGPFIVDFYCASYRLVVEVDGGIHDDQAEHDAVRTAQLEAYGNQVIRFRNEEVLTDLQLVLQRISAAALNSSSPQDCGKG